MILLIIYKMIKIKKKKNFKKKLKNSEKNQKIKINY